MRTPKAPRLRDGTRWTKIFASCKNYQQRPDSEISSSSLQRLRPLAISAANAARPRYSPARHLLEMFGISRSLHIDF